MLAVNQTIHCASLAEVASLARLMPAFVRQSRARSGCRRMEAHKSTNTALAIEIYMEFDTPADFTAYQAWLVDTDWGAASQKMRIVTQETEKLDSWIPPL